MSTPPVKAPPIEALVTELVATLAYAGNAYLADESADRHAALDAAGIAADLAGAAFERIEPRLAPEERSALSGLLTDLRLTYVRKRGQ